MTSVAFIAIESLNISSGDSSVDVISLHKTLSLYQVDGRRSLTLLQEHLSLVLRPSVLEFVDCSSRLSRKQIFK